MNENITMNDNQMNMNINIDIFKDTEPIICENCGSQTFVPVLFLRKISPIVSPTGKEELIPIQTYKCSECGHINKEFNFFSNNIDITTD